MQQQMRDLPIDELDAIERLAVELVNLAGAEITSALGSILQVRYKGASDAEQLFRDPVSETDTRIEQLIRARLAETYPDHEIIGEEFSEEGARGADFAWAIDPIDGTANFVNGFPLFSATIGVLFRGVPVVGAVWCATSHALRPGIYHAQFNGKLCFDRDPVVPRHNPAIRRRLAGVPHAPKVPGVWDSRKTGSAAIECAFVAAGLLEAARFEQPNVWDVAGGIALVQASGGTILSERDGTWTMFRRFEGAAGSSTSNPQSLRSWRAPLIVGRGEADSLLAGMAAAG